MCVDFKGDWYPAPNSIIAYKCVHRRVHHATAYCSLTDTADRTEQRDIDIIRTVNKRGTMCWYALGEEYTSEEPGFYMFKHPFHGISALLEVEIPKGVYCRIGAYYHSGCMHPTINALRIKVLREVQSPIDTLPPVA